MNKIFTLTVMAHQVDAVDYALRELDKKIIDIDVSKIFNVNDYSIMVYTMVCTDKTFNELNEMIGGTRIY